MQRHAYLIMAHHQFALLEMLLKLMDDERNDFYIHIDRSAGDIDFARFNTLMHKSSLRFIDRKKVNWGAYSQIDVELRLLTAALPGKYSYYHMLSGADLPIKTADEIYDFFEGHSGTEFIHFCKDRFTQSEAVRNRVRLYHFLQEGVPKGGGLIRNCERVSLRLQRLLGVDRLKHINVPLSCGSNWFSITDALARYLLENEGYIRRHFGQGFCADEFFVQTLVGSSKFLERCYLRETQDDYQSCMRMIDWQRGAPYIYRTEDYDLLMNAPHMFARKFDLDVDSNICRMIYETLR